ncbi:TIGR03936 family radical SAM-associated protein [Dehalococcoidia bacterium]|nr:TIGR03936 family radical SAM-associated protein [Dehalococcoidia bacterium]
MKRFLSSKGEPQQRLCLTFGRGEEVKYITHLDVMRLWHRALRRAGMPLSYSQGFNPRPRISTAAPLPLGVTSEAELMDIFLERKVSLHFFVRAVSEQLPPGIKILGVRECWPKLPSLQSRLRFAEYRVEVESERTPEEVSQALCSLLAKKSLPWQHARDKEIRHYDLRALINALWLIDQGHARYTLGMVLRSDSRGSGKPEQVTAALEFSEYPKSIHRTKLILA